jgi:hypothetical protein
MRIDLYTKTILTLIALPLAAIALKPILHPESKSAAMAMRFWCTMLEVAIFGDI